MIPRPQLARKPVSAAIEKRVSLAQLETARDRVLTRCGEFLFGQSTAVEEAFAREQRDSLLIGVEDKRYILRQAGNGSTPPEVECATGLYCIRDLVNSELAKPEPIIEGLLHEGDTGLVGGRPKVGKSRLIHQMVLSLSYATPFLGMAVPRKRRVLLIDLENKPWSIKDRLVKMAGPGAEDIDTAFVWCSESLAENALTSKPEGIQNLQALLDKTDAEVLIIDPWRLWLGGDENGSEEIVRGLTQLSRLRKSRPGLTIVIVHHVRKERFESPTRLLRDPSLWVENISGHHALVSHVDCCYGLDRQEHNGEDVVVFGGVARNVEPHTLLLNDDPETLRFDIAANEEAAIVTMTEKEREAFGKIKTLRGRFTWTDAFAAAKTTNKKLVTAVLRKAQGHGVITKFDDTYQLVRVPHRN